MFRMMMLGLSDCAAPITGNSAADDSRSFRVFILFFSNIPSCFPRECLIAANCGVPGFLPAPELPELLQPALQKADRSFSFSIHKKTTDSRLKTFYWPLSADCCPLLITWKSFYLSQNNSFFSYLSFWPWALWIFPFSTGEVLTIHRPRGWCRLCGSS